MRQEEKILQFSLLKAFPPVVCAVSTRAFGSIKQRGIVCYDNAKDFSAALNVPITNCVFTRQVHGNAVIAVENAERLVIGRADGLLTQQKDIVVGMATGDCLPIVFFEKNKNIIGVVHAGFKGLLVGIIESMLEEIIKRGGESKNVIAGIGPGIGVCCYNVGEDRTALFTERFPTFRNMFEKRNGQLYLDIKSVAKQILVQQGVLEENIEIMPYCTSDNNDLFYSFRKDSKETFGEFATVIGIR
jgi:YfiH family protein